MAAAAFAARAATRRVSRLNARRPGAVKSNDTTAPPVTSSASTRGFRMSDSDSSASSSIAK